ncbi:hypothetical protein, partial [Coralloluteibacterium stylophorae]
MPSNAPLRRLPAVALQHLALALALVASALGGAAPAAALAAPGGAALDALATRLEDGAVSAEARPPLQDALQQAREDAAAAESALAAADALREEADRAGREVEDLEARLARDTDAELAAWRRRQPSTTSVAAIERRRAQVQAEYERLRGDLEQTAAALGRILTSPSTLDPALVEQEAALRDAAANARAASERDPEDPAAGVA